MKEIEDLPRGRVTSLPDKIRRSYPFAFDDGGEECLIDRWGSRHCSHEHPEAAPQLQDVYREIEGWTAQS